MSEIVKKNSGVDECPAFELVSAYYDGELAADDSVCRHIAACPLCAEALAACAAIDKRLGEHFLAALDDGLEDRIAAGVAEKINHASRSISFPVMLTRIAASLFIGALAGLVTMSVVDWRPPKESPSAAAAEKKAPVRPAWAGESGFTGGGVIPYSNFSKVSFGDSPGAPAGRSAAAGPVLIPGQVRQVWVSGDLNRTRGLIENFVAGEGIPSNRVMLSSKGDGLKLNVRLTKRQLVDLVRECAASGSELLTPKAPQPEQSSFIGSAAAKVQYNAEFFANGQ